VGGGSGFGLEGGDAAGDDGQINATVTHCYDLLQTKQYKTILILNFTCIIKEGYLIYTQ
jgi:hypothetical protein